MARKPRRTEPQETREGLLVEFASLEPLLVESEARGRSWLFQLTTRLDRGSVPSDHDLLELHRVMFGPVFGWAGTTRRVDVRVGGEYEVRVPWHEVRIALRLYADDLRARVAAVLDDHENIQLAALAAVIADAHHRFQWVHPFQDTNGRTGRTLDHYLLWVTFGLAGEDLASSPTIEHFPHEAAEVGYYQGLVDADRGRPERLHRYYEERLASSVAALGDL